MYFANSNDQPQAWKAKRLIFYQVGIKIYGQIPYILQKRLGATFISSESSFMGGRIIGPTFEDNYTIVPYRRSDGTEQKPEAINALLDWLLSDRGCEYTIAIAGEFERSDLLRVNWLQMPPETWTPGDNNLQKLIEDLSWAN